MELTFDHKLQELILNYSHMSVLLYARVSCGKQAERQLSIPAQLRLAKRYAEEHGLQVAGSYHEVASGKLLKDRPGLLALLSHARRDKGVDGVVVHKIDRLARNTFNYLLLKSKLRSSGAHLYSVVETIDESPMGEFMENIMAAQAEYFSANLTNEIKKGREEKLLRGRWMGALPLGYLMKEGRVVLDPARSQFVRQAFELWSTGNWTSITLSGELYQRGLLGRSGQQLLGKRLCELLRNPFYAGIMRVGGKEYPGIHPLLATKELFERCQEVFKQKKGHGRKACRHLTFILAKKVRCPWCASTLITDHHQKKSGKIYRYYRCHPPVCAFTTRAEAVEEWVSEYLLKLHLPERLGPVLRKRVAQTRHSRTTEQVDRIKHLRQECRRLRSEEQSLAQVFGEGRLSTSFYEEQRKVLQESHRAAECLLANTEDGHEHETSESVLLEKLKTLPQVLRGTDVISKRQLLDSLIERVELSGEELKVVMNSAVQELLDESMCVVERVRLPVRNSQLPIRTLFMHQKTAR